MAYYQIPKPPRLQQFISTSAQKGATGPARARREQGRAERRARKRRMRAAGIGQRGTTGDLVRTSIAGGAAAAITVAIPLFGLTVLGWGRIPRAMVVAATGGAVAFLVTAVVVALTTWRGRPAMARGSNVPGQVPDGATHRARTLRRRAPWSSRGRRAMATGATAWVLATACGLAAGIAGNDWHVLVGGLLVGAIVAAVVFLIVYRTSTACRTGWHMDAPGVGVRGTASARGRGGTDGFAAFAFEETEAATGTDQLAPPRAIVGKSLPRTDTPDPHRVDAGRCRHTESLQPPRPVAGAPPIRRRVRIGESAVQIAVGMVVVAVPLLVILGHLFNVTHARIRSNDTVEHNRVAAEHWERHKEPVPAAAFDSMPKMSLECWLDTPPEQRPHHQRVVLEIVAFQFKSDLDSYPGYVHIWLRAACRNLQPLTGSDRRWHGVHLLITPEQHQRLANGRRLFPANPLVVHMSPPPPNSSWDGYLPLRTVGVDATLDWLGGETTAPPPTPPVPGSESGRAPGRH